MKTINTGDNTYQVYGDNLRVYDKLPAQSYVVRVSESRGFYLSKYVEMEITESKIYGVHAQKVDKVLTAFEEMNRNLGVILSGDKGIGKSLFTKILAAKAISKGIPVIVVEKYIGGIASYIESIEQEVMVLFDEFDKTFGEVKTREGEATPQTALLSLFDGLSEGKKLFVITCNNLYKLNEFLINRPGRFHYHFRFNYPSNEDIKEYLQDKLNPQYYSQIPAVLMFNGKVQLNYDCLRAIAFELNHGLTFADAIQDLNILNMDDTYYSIIVKMENGFILKNKRFCADFFEDPEKAYEVDLVDSNSRYIGDIAFMVENMVFNHYNGTFTVDPSKAKISYNNPDSDIAKSLKATKISSITIRRNGDRDLHYSLV